MAPQPSEPIAVIGSGCRFPGGSTTPSKLWNLLKQPQDILRKIPKERFDPEVFHHPNGLHPGTSNVQHSYMIDEDFRHFDAQFFNIKPVEAESIDPQQRILLETVYEALEAAGQTIEGLQGSDTSVYVGLMCLDYHDVGLRDLSAVPTYFATGSARSIISNRVSYFFDWRGPSMTIDTACSSSLVSVHQAVQTLRAGESRVAVAAGANLILGPEPFITESKLKMLSPDGRSRMWDKDANGYARGDGFAAVVLKTLSAALEDGDEIECIIRETSVNQDGRTKGITMPSSEAQEQLIRSTYAKAGLDVKDEKSRCQYFEAHGTGTPAGDPQEAEAIRNAFYGRDAVASSSPDDKLYVGSIKTVIGHTEGTAGLAGLLKAGWAVKHGIIPPNLLLNELSPSVEPFYGNLQIPSSALPWPQTPEGSPRRASVNSFGFGGTNSHAIIENYRHPNPITNGVHASSALSVGTPFVFSAASETALRSLLVSYAEYLKREPDVDLKSLAYTLQSRRTNFSVRTTIFAASVDDLVSKLEEAAKKSETEDGGFQQSSSSNASPRILGVFTGQGAQWAQMGKELILNSEFCRRRLLDLDDALRQLPGEHRPTWSIVEELLKDASSSNIAQAAYSQPLCTAIQVVLVDLWKAAGIQFSAVVGHSSGEIAAAYAAGFIDSADAIRIAYYRGYFAPLAKGTLDAAKNAAKGAMMAASTSFEDAADLCEIDELAGRVNVAAVNSSSSVTFSGDSDAIQELQGVFEEEKKFARVLKVDTAYHSHHMTACGPPYTKALESCRVHTHCQNTNSSWFSSVKNGEKMASNQAPLPSYWEQNMLQPVLFYQAVSSAVAEAGPFSLAIEVGPHPALKGPASQTIEEITGEKLPYVGTLQRGTNDVESFSNALGYIWERFGSSALDFSSYDKLLLGSSESRLLKGLPTYPWDHDRLFWYESRISKKLRNNECKVHDLLGSQLPHSTDNNIVWQNLIRPEDIPWVDGHQLQGQTVFPAAAYAVMALEAGVFLAKDKSIQLLEIEDLTIGRPITFDDSSSSAEVMFAVSLANAEDPEVLNATFTCHSSTNRESTKMALNASGKLRIVIGEQSIDTLPISLQDTSNLNSVDESYFYTSLKSLGYEYSGPFKGLNSVSRRLGNSTGWTSESSSEESGDETFLVHPATLDQAFQAIFLAYSAPGDGRIWSLHVPTFINRITVNPIFANASASDLKKLYFTASLLDPLASDIDGDVDMFLEEGANKFIQVQGVKAIPFSEATPANDCELFSEVIWDLDLPDGLKATRGERATTEDYDLALVCERVAYYYLRQLDAAIPPEKRTTLEWHHKQLMSFSDKILNEVKTNTHPFVKKEWISDDESLINDISKRYPDSIDLKLMHAVGKVLPLVLRGETTILEHMMRDSMLHSYYIDALGISEYTEHLARLIKQFSHRYPHLKVLEIGAGTGGATKSILRELGDKFSSYTFTDISTGYFERAQDIFAGYRDKMSFKALDIEKDISSQGYKEQSYDLVIASMVIHATESLEKTLQNARSLVKPGGYLVMLEITDNRPMRIGFTMSGLSGWWLGKDDGRLFSPCVTPDEWDGLLRKTGFAGIDTITPNEDYFPYPLSVIVSQAVDDRIETFREPLIAQPGSVPDIEDLVIVGGSTMQNSKLVNSAEGILARYCGNVSRFRSLSDADFTIVSPETTVLFLQDLDEPIFKNSTAEKLSGLKELLYNARDVVWITRGCRADDPYANMSVGLARTVAMELPHLRLQLLDLPFSSKPDATIIVETLIRWHSLGIWQKGDFQDKHLLSIEAELAFEGERFLVPRVYPSQERNNRYNSARRKINVDSYPEDSVLSISHTKSGYDVQMQPTMRRTVNSANTVQLQVLNSTLFALKTASDAKLHLVIGKQVGSDNYFLGFSDSNASRVRLPKDWLLPLDSPDQSRLLPLVAAAILGEAILSGTSSYGKLVVHEAPAALMSVLPKAAAEKDIHVTFTTTNKDNDGSALFIHPNSTVQAIRHLLPEGVTRLVDLSQGASRGYDTSFLSKSFGAGASFEEISNLLAHDTVLGHVSSQSLQSQLHAALSIAHSVTPTKTEWHSLGDLSNIKASATPLSVLNWTTETPVLGTLHPVDSTEIFDPKRTYLLFGLTGGLGRSLCDWMVRRGARHIVITSRSPKIDDEWLNKFRNCGAIIKVMANDITDKDSVYDLVATVRATMPPIAGVANGAMLLRDTTFFDLDLETLVSVFKPKVDGTMYLDALFQDDQLDFFILFSSLACVFGNSGQSNYTAANMFMTSLAANRQKRGQVASVIDIGAIVGAGYFDRELTQGRREELKRMGYMWMSERDFHQIFAEAVVAGLPENGQVPEIVTGLRTVRADQPDDSFWFHNAKFQHCIKMVGSSESEESSLRSNLSTKARIQEAVTTDELDAILTDAFASKLQMMLQFRSDNVSDLGIMLKKPLDELGVDSLVAVDIRAWFLKELDVDIPVLKILGGVSTKELILIAAEKIPSELIPNMGSERSIAPNNKSVTPSALATPYYSSTSPASSDGTDNEKTPESSSESVTSMEEIPETKKEPTVIERPTFVKTNRISFGQRRFWFLRSYLEDDTAFNITCRIRVRGKLRVNDLARAVAALGQRHEALRTCYFEDDEQQPCQGVMKNSLLRMETKKNCAPGDSAREHALLKQHVYDLERGEAMKFLLLTENDDLHYIVLGYHHINMDGVSLQVVLSDLEKLYSYQKLPKTLQYPDYTNRQLDNLENGVYNEDLKFWREEFTTFPEALPLFSFSKVKNRSPMSAYNFKRCDLRIDAATSTLIKEISREQKATAFHFHVGLLRVLLARFLSIDDLCIGFADANRLDSDTMTAVGYYLNLLPLRFAGDATEVPFTTVLQQSRTKAYSALAHSKIPFDVILDKLGAPRSPNHSPVFQAFIDYRQGAAETQPFDSCELYGDMFEMGKTAYDINIDIIDNPNGDTLITFMLQDSLYSQDAVELVGKSYLHLVDQICANPSLEMKDASLFSQEDINKSIALGQGPITEQEWPDTIVHRVEEMVQKYPNSIALKDGAGTVSTYSEMANRVNAIASALLAANVQRQDRVGVFQEPTTDWICSLLAILRIGATYVPLDIRNPMERLLAIVDSSGASAILSHNSTWKDINSFDSRNVSKINVSELNTTSIEPVPISASADSIALVLYTSGSTGVPKGIVLKHVGIRNEIESKTKLQDIGIEKVLQQTALSFDITLEQVFIALANGGSLFVLPQTKRGDPQEIITAIATEGITFTLATPSEYMSMLRYGNAERVKSCQWRIAVTGGEHFPLALKRELANLGKEDLRFYVGYGPAETSIYSHINELFYNDDTGESEFNSLTPAGWSLPNYSTYILDENLNALPVGVPGEVAIGGIGVGVGYINNTELTDEKFQTDPFASPEAIKRGWTRLHRTGDKGRLMNDGRVLIEGRLDGDTQIKIRGVRIDLKDIESTIINAANGSLDEVVVTFLESQQILAAHVLFSPTAVIKDKNQFLQELLRELPLPQYMCPAIAIPLERVPLTMHNKIDRRAIAAMPLPAIQKAETSSKGLTTAETVLRDSWMEVLPGEITAMHTIDADTDFFQVGGNSFLLVTLQSVIKDKFRVITKLNDLLGASSLGRMAALLERMAKIDGIDWELETKLPDTWKDLLPAQTPIDRKPKKTVLITGATGYMGTLAIDQLDRMPEIETIHCLAIRDHNRGMHTHSDKVIFHPGDLVKPNFGLDDATFDKLSQEVDAIFHIAALRSFFEHFQVYRWPNVESTKELVRLALPRQIPIHLVSSGAVRNYSDGVLPPTDGTDGYVASKWAGEKVLTNAAEMFGLEVFFHRPAAAIEPRFNSIEAFEEFRRMSAKMKIRPDRIGWKGTLDLLEGDTLMSSMLEQGLTSPRSPGKVHAAHYVCPERVQAEALSEYLDEHLEITDDFQDLPAHKWVGQAKYRGFIYLVASQDLTFTDMDDGRTTLITKR